MKILQDIQEFINISIVDKNIELEYIYGYRNNRSINKETFIKLLDYLKKEYKFVDEDNTLDIRREIDYKGRKSISSIRGSINGLHSIQQHCKTEDLGDMECIIKTNIKDMPPIVDKNYDYRLNIKKEEPLREKSEQLESFKKDWTQTKKHYRFKKRYSFHTSSDLFRIDLTVVKSSKWNQTLEQFELHKTFLESKVLSEPENYELEIEYMGNNTEQGKKNLIKYINTLKLEGTLETTTEFQPLSPDLNFKPEKSEDKGIKDLIGEYVIIKDSHLKTLDKSLFKKLSGLKICYVTDFMVIGDLTYAMLDIEDMDQLIVSISDIYNENWDPDALEDTYDIKVTDKLLENINESFNDVIYDVLTIIESTKLLLKADKKRDILNGYYKLTNQEKRKKKVFMAPQPVTLNLNQLNPEDPTNIYENYAVTDKADGFRYLLYIDENKHGYLINSKLDKILDTGVEFPNIKGEWLLDGEYIQKDKNNLDIQLFMVFDVYYAEREIDVEPFKLPFVSFTDSISREKVLERFSQEYLKNMKIVSEDFKSFRIFNKKYEYGSMNVNMSDEGDKNILLKSKIILNKNKNDGYEYEIDGLIYLPVNIPVSADSDGKPKEFINGTWKHNFKWKPPEENTIDFKVSVIKETIDRKKYQTTRDKKFPYNIIDDDGNELVEYYKQVKLLVSYDETKDINLEYYLKILEPIKKNSSKLIVFNPPDENIDYGKTNIKLINNKMICEKDNREILNGDIVEMRFNENALNGFIWEPLKVRSDKINPQWFLAANNVWSTIRNPISQEMIGGNIDVKTIQDYIPDNINSDLYYVEESDNMTSSCLRKFHNFIKYNLITGICYGKEVSIMDTSIGRGGDLRKYIQQNFRCKFLFGLDLNSINEASRRYYYMQHKKPNAVFLRYNTSKNIIEGDGVYNNNPEYPDLDIEHSETMINILYGEGKTIPPRYKNIRAKYNKESTKKFDVISCQFSLHYYFESQHTFNGFLSNLTDNCKSGGYFIGTCYDGERLFNMMKNVDKLEYRDRLNNLVYRIKKDYTIKSLDEQLFGNKIDVYMDSIGEEYPEYLVNFNKFVEIMKENEFELVKPDMKTQYDIFDGPINSFSTILKQLDGFKSDPNFMRYYKESLDILKNDELSLLSSLNNYFIFKKK